MKFEYDRKERDEECVAYIDIDGDLIFMDLNNNCSMISIDGDGASTYTELPFDPSEASHKFYPGDKITITF